MSRPVLASPVERRAFDILEPISWHDKTVPEREWLVPGLLPLRNVTMLAGDGGLGKSLLALQLMAACALGSTKGTQTWLGRDALPCKVFGVFCEDEQEELHRRLVDVTKYYQADLADLDGMQVMSRVGLDNALMTWRNAWEPGESTGFYVDILNHVTNAGAQLIVLDSLHDLFPGDENKRTHARQFINELRTFATETNGAVLLTAHPSLSGRNSGSGEAGNTAWNNAVRSRLYLTKPDTSDKNERRLKTMKANYAGQGNEIRLRWSEGVLDAMSDHDAVDSIIKARIEDAFLACLDTASEQGRPVTDSSNSPRYAPLVFTTMGEANGYKKLELTQAMHRLFNAGAIRIGSVLADNRHERKAIVRTGKHLEKEEKPHAE